jgi:protein O-GlcNAc transferase
MNSKEQPISLPLLSDRISTFIQQYRDSKTEKDFIETIAECRRLINFTETLNPVVVERYSDCVKKLYYASAELHVRLVGINNGQDREFNQQEKGVLFMSLEYLKRVLYLEPFHPETISLYKLIVLCICLLNSDTLQSETLLENVLSIDPGDVQIQYNLGFIKHRLNQMEASLQHYKLCLRLIDIQIENGLEKNETLMDFKMKSLNGLGSIYYAIQDRRIAEYYFKMALDVKPEDPDIHNQLGVIFTELRFTDKAIFHYKKALEYSEKAQISGDIAMLQASVYMNMGLAYCYEINYPEAIECYNKALVKKPRLSLAYQNKLLDLNYVSYMIEDPMYVAQQHKNIDKVYPEVHQVYQNEEYTPKNIKRGDKLVIGFMSGDFVCHPVSYFMNGILKYIDTSKFEVHLFSLKMGKNEKIHSKYEWHLVKNMNPPELANKIKKIGVDILFDLSSQTGDNRLDTFALKAAPIQISYAGYPGTSGLSNMDFHITDNYADSDGMTPGPNSKIRPSTQKYYSEKLIFMPHSFLAYTPSIETLLELHPTPCTVNGYLTIGCFNRYNKVNQMVTQAWEDILKRCPTVRLVVKTKEFLTPSLLQQFKDSFVDQSVLDRVKILTYSDTYEEHLQDYDCIDFALDTFPYSGTTTSCEALMQGTPIITIFDEERQYHSQNVTASILINSDLSEYVCYSQSEYVEKVCRLAESDFSKYTNLKKETRDKFILGRVCDNQNFVKAFSDKISEAYTSVVKNKI